MADTVGNLLGPRATFLYETDAGTSYNISLDRSVSEGVGNELSTVNVSTIYASGTIPVEPRYILVQAADDARVRKSIIVCDPTNELFARDAGGTVTINGRAFVITGRVGEKATFTKLTPAPAPD